MPSQKSGLKSKYDPRASASAPVRAHTWETISKTSQDYKIPKKTTTTFKPTQDHVIPSVTRKSLYAKTIQERDAQIKLNNHRNRGITQLKSLPLLQVYMQFKNRPNPMALFYLDPRKKAVAHPAYAQAEETEDQKYLKWLNQDAIPNTRKNIDYYEKLADNIRHDIFVSEEQISAAETMKKQGVQIDITTAVKLRRQMDEKLVETLTKQLKQKTKLQGLLKVKSETEIKSLNGKVTRFAQADVTTMNYSLMFYIQTQCGAYIKDCIPSSPISPSRAFASSTSTPLSAHPLLQPLIVTPPLTPRACPVPDHQGHNTSSPRAPEVPDKVGTGSDQVITLYEGVNGPLPEYNGYEVYTDSNGISYALDPRPIDQPAHPEGVQVVDTSGLHIKAAYDVHFDPETAALIAGDMGRKSKRAAETSGAGSPTKKPKTAASTSNAFNKTYSHEHPVNAKSLSAGTSEETTGKNNIHDPNETVREEGNSSANMSTNTTDSPFFYQDAEDEIDPDDGDMEDSRSTYRETGNTTPRSVSYTHLTLPTTPYV